MDHEHLERLAKRHHDTLGELVEYFRDLRRPTLLRTLELSATTPVVRDEVRDTSLSILVVNPNDAVLRLGVAGGSAQPTARGIPVPAAGALQLPIATEDVEIGLDDPTVLAGEIAVVYVVRFATVQPFFLGALS